MKRRLLLRTTAESVPPKRGCNWDGVFHGHVRSGERHLPGVQRLNSSDDHPTGEQRAFDRVRRFSGEYNVFDVPDQWVEKIGGCGAATGHRQIHLAGYNLVS